MTVADRERRIVDYDADGYDYRGFWQGRDYEHWAEAHVLRRLVATLGRPQWLVDFGGGFGRNAVHYLDRVDHAVIVDYSVTNLERASELYRTEIEDGRLFLVRADINRLPFIDAAFDSAIVVRVLHHLPTVSQTLAEMSRVIGRQWIIDVPIKHHLLGRARAAMHREWSDVASAEPHITGDSRYPFYNFQLRAIRERLGALSWDTDLAASVNNFRRWDRSLPRPAVATLRPLVYSLERVAQTVGRGWWGPSQFLVAHRRPALVAHLQPAVVALESSVDGVFARRMRCPHDGAMLRWTPSDAGCADCGTTYLKRGAFWDMTRPS